MNNGMTKFVRYETMLKHLMVIAAIFIMALGMGRDGYCDSVSKGMINLGEKIVCLTTNGNEIVSCKKDYDGTVFIPDNVKEVGSSAFAGCSNVTSVCWHSGVEFIGESAFRDCVRLSHLTIPVSVKDIGAHAFHGCSNLKYVALTGVRSIGDGAFAGCEKLTHVVLPESLRTVGDNVFQGCDSLDRVDFQGLNVRRMCIGSRANLIGGRTARLFMSQGRWQVDFARTYPQGDGR